MSALYEIDQDAILDAIELKHIAAHYDFSNDTIWVDALDAAHLLLHPHWRPIYMLLRSWNHNERIQSTMSLLAHLNLNYLRIFLVVYRTRSMTQAAKELHLTQSGESANKIPEETLKYHALWPY